MSQPHEGDDPVPSTEGHGDAALPVAISAAENHGYVPTTSSSISNSNNSNSIHHHSETALLADATHAVTATATTATHVSSDGVGAAAGVGLLCASCDSCRARKAKCDGQRPCSHCGLKYMKKHHLSSLVGIDYAEFDCVYSPAKRRGPIPGRSSGVGTKTTSSSFATTGTSGRPSLSGQARKASEIDTMPLSGSGTATTAGLLQYQQQQQSQQQQQMFYNNVPHHQQLLAPDVSGNNAAGTFGTHSLESANGMMMMRMINEAGQVPSVSVGASAMSGNHLHDQPMDVSGDIPSVSRQRTRLDAPTTTLDPRHMSSSSGAPWTVMQHTHLLDANDAAGERLRSYYQLSVNELYHLPPTPTNEEYYYRILVPLGLQQQPPLLSQGPLQLDPAMSGDPRQIRARIPGGHLAALAAARFAELTLGAIAHHEVALALELGNAVVHCLREAVKTTRASSSTDPQNQLPTVLIQQVAKAYFLLGTFRAFRADLVRYFKYRRVCLTYLSQIEEDDVTQIILAAMAYLDAWAYMIYNSNEKAVPNVDGLVPQVSGSVNSLGGGVCRTPSAIVINPLNQTWIQGSPPVFLNLSAPTPARALDALACAVRTCCDQANGRFAAIAKENNPDRESTIPEHTIFTPTTTAVLANEGELCSRNMILSAFALMQQNDALKDGPQGFQGQKMVIAAMDAFLENGDDSGKGPGFTDSQIQSLVSVCNTVIENPLLLYHAGPTYHMVTNAAILLCHLLNGLQAIKDAENLGVMESALFEEVIDTFMAVRKILTVHRRKLPVQLRCHALPRPMLIEQHEKGQSLIDMGETVLCSCRGCQGFVLMACSPCVAAERARDAQLALADEAAREAEAIEMGAFDALDYALDSALGTDGTDFDMDDDDLVNLIGSLIASGA